MFILDAIGDAINAFYNTAAAGILAAIVKMWNSVVKLAYGLLSVTPQQFQDGSPWAIIESIYPYFIAIGSSLVALFFIIGFCTESVNLKDEMRMENVIKMLIKLVLAEGLITNGLSLMKQIFKIAASMTGLVKNGYPVMTAHEEWVETLMDGNGMLNFLLLILVLIVGYVAGGILLYMIYSRFFKLFMIIPLAPLALSTVAGSGGITHTASSWIRSFLAYSLEIVVIALALSLSGSFLNSAGSIFPTESGTLGAVLAVGNVAFTMLITAGTVKGAENVIRKALGL